jgi:hypothetical protein
LSDNSKITITEKTNDPKNPRKIVKVWGELKSEVMATFDPEVEKFTPYNEKDWWKSLSDDD